MLLLFLWEICLHLCVLRVSRHLFGFPSDVMYLRVPFSRHLFRYLSDVISLTLFICVRRLKGHQMQGEVPPQINEARLQRSTHLDTSRSNEVNQVPIGKWTMAIRVSFAKVLKYMTLEKSCPLQIKEISTSNKFPRYFSTKFQNISIPWKCPKGWKYRGNLLEVAMISMIWRGNDFSSAIRFVRAWPLPRALRRWCANEFFRHFLMPLVARLRSWMTMTTDFQTPWELRH